MPVTIDQIEVEPASGPAPQPVNATPGEAPKPDPREVEQMLERRRERLERLRAH